MADVADTEEPVRFACDGETLVGVLARVPRAARVGVLIVVGGPQYRAGSHRQFVLLARQLARAGWPSLRFDYRGMGDSSGAARSFEHVEQDIRAAIDTFERLVPGLGGVVIWGLCDAASAALMYAPSDRRVSGLALANPWARAPETYASTRLRHYYLQRVFAPQLWRKLVSGRFDFRQSARDLWRHVSHLVRRRQPSQQEYRSRMLHGLRSFAGPVLWLISGRDLTAREFLLLLQREGETARVADGNRTTRCDLSEADHTFARAEWRAEVERATAAWLASHWDTPSASRAD
jgi:exosortase A-associated hydrolase 1